ncbi:MAG: glycosyltransferase family 2 protein [Acidobacteria bacterium]|nr:glycosyltransferase family 2 protein [Acidobacteriota bacterium]
MTPRLTIGITTRNRAGSLNACLRSLDLLAPLAPEILVFDDGSSPPAADQIDGGLPRPRILRDAASPGYIVGRNRLVREAAAPAVLLLDDDTRILSLESLEQALQVLDGDRSVAAIAFAQTEADGRPWPAAMQASPAQSPAIVASFIGFAHLVRRDAFLSVGGYREEFVHTGEEKDLCLRWLDGGRAVVYLPSAGIAHVTDPSGRDRARYLRRLVRNDCLNALYNDPLPRVLWTVPARYALYFRMRSAWGIRDPWGWAWIVRELGSRILPIVASRRPVSRATVRQWRALTRAPRPYAISAPAGRVANHA